MDTPSYAQLMQVGHVYISTILVLLFLPTILTLTAVALVVNRFKKLELNASRTALDKFKSVKDQSAEMAMHYFQRSDTHSHLSDLGNLASEITAALLLLNFIGLAALLITTNAL